MKRSFFFLCSLGLAIASFYLLCSAVYYYYGLHPVDLAACYQLFPGNENFLKDTIRPEPAENLCYLAGIVWLPVSAFLAYLFLIWLDRKYNTLFVWAENKTFNRIIDAALVLGAVIGGYIILRASNAENGTGHFFINYGHSSLWSILVLFLPLAALAWRRAPAVSKLYFYAGIAAAGLVSLTQIVPASMFVNEFEVTFNLSIFLGTVNQAFLGKTMLADCFSQYGILWPHCFELLLHIIGFTITNLSLIFASLSFLTWLSILLALRGKMGDSWFLPLSLLSIIGLSYTMAISENNFHPYFAYLPLRTICPALGIWLVSSYIQRENRLKYLSGFVLCGVGALWNLETGITLTLAWLGFLAYSSLAKKHNWRVIAGHFACAVLAFAAAAAAYSLFAYLRSGQCPQWPKLFEYQSIFYLTGYAMLPMKKIDLWYLPALLYAAVVFSAGRALLLEKNAGANDRFYFFLALLGAGAFAYFQGRSHLRSFFLVTYPFTVLLACLLYDRREKLLAGTLAFRERIAGSIMAIIFCFGLVHFAAGVPLAYSYYTDNILNEKAIPPATQAAIARVASFIKERTASSEVLIFSSTDEYLHYLTSTRSPLYFSSNSSLILKRHMAEVQKYIDTKRPAEIFVIPASFAGALLSFEGYAARPKTINGLPIMEYRLRRER
jgi:hypothetical protein